jgi:hypothetical protein
MSNDNPIVIVSGLPRSGTSLMMQMLQAGGLSLLIDDHRPPDQSNPRGYFEYENVKSLAVDSTWMGEARGKGLKVIAQLTPFLPLGFHYKIIFMNRNLKEIIRSQTAMIESQGGMAGDGAVLASIYRSQVDAARAMLGQRPQTSLITIEHLELLSASEETVERIATFLERPDLNKLAMVAAIDRALYRARSNAVVAN